MFVITEKAHTRAFCLLKAPTSSTVLALGGGLRLLALWPGLPPAPSLAPGLPGSCLIGPGREITELVRCCCAVKALV